MLEALLALESGRVFCGRSFGAPGESFGEVVFNTAITGYQEILTDPTGKVEIISQNHGFTVAKDALGSEVECTHLNLYDDTVEGIQLRGRPVFGVQYHPEASPGPRDASYLFSRFVAAMRS
jgi:carbamoyl-phosphate synthase small subunit